MSVIYDSKSVPTLVVVVFHFIPCLWCHFRLKNPGLNKTGTFIAVYLNTPFKLGFAEKLFVKSGFGPQLLSHER